MATAQINPLMVGDKWSNLVESVEIPDSLRRLAHGEKPAPGCGVLRILNPKTGDDRYTWDSRSLAEIRDAKATFDSLVAKGLVPYRVGPDGRKSPEVMEEFDPLAEEVIFAPIAAAVAG